MFKKIKKQNRKNKPQSNNFAGAVTRMSRPKSFMARWATIMLGWSVIALIAIFALTSLVVGIVNLQTMNKLEQRLTKEYNPSLKIKFGNAGEEVIRSYFSKTQPPLALANGVTWTTKEKSKKTDEISLLRAKAKNITVENITLISGKQRKLANGSYAEELKYSLIINGQRQTAEIVIGIPDLYDNSKEPFIFTEPRLGPPIKNDFIEQSLAPSKIDGYTNLQLSDKAIARIEEFAKAYTDDDKQKIKEITGDSSESIYNGIGGKFKYEKNSLKIIWSAQKGKQKVAEIAWTMKTDSTIYKQIDGKEIELEGTLIKERMNILLEDVETSLPKIISWGAVGSYNELVKFGSSNSFLSDKTPVVKETIEEKAKPKTAEPVKTTTPEATPVPVVTPTPRPTPEPEPTEKQNNENLENQTQENREN